MKYFLRGIVVPLLIISIAAGCQSSQPVAESPSENQRDVTKSSVNYTLIYVVHGDANYLYHDSDGNEKQADAQELKEAKRTAQKALHGEVFIFNQLPEDKLLWIFPKKDRRMLHYKNGELIQRIKYSPSDNSKRLVRESELFKKHRLNDSGNSTNNRLFFLYYGHEIPGQNYYGYDTSRSDAPMSRRLFTEGVEAFLQGDEQFELSVLSTCDNGTPLMAESLSSSSQYLLASPQDLHLSYLDSEPLLRLEDDLAMPIADVARAVAKKSYRRLSNFLHTAVTISVYNLDAVNSYIHRLANDYQNSVDEDSIDVMQEVNTDCAIHDFWEQDTFTKGVTTYYQPPQFGKNADHKTHSGWGCLPD